MSMYSGLTRDKDGRLLKDGKPHVVGCDTGDDTPVKVDERFDVDINKLVSNEMARQDLLRIPGEQDYQDLTDYPESRGDATHRLVTLERSLRPNMLPGESFEQAMTRVLAAQAKVQASQVVRADSEPKAAPGAPSSVPSSPPKQGNSPAGETQ